ncbi:MAG: hypothetical protein R2831_01495 [Chitinophagaceae bacterium]
MSNLNEIQDTLNLEEHDFKKLPSNLNVLTILTYIGSAFAFIGGIYSYFTICKSVEKMNSIDLDDLGGGMMQKMVEGSMVLAEKQCDNKLLILIATLLCTALCFWGAMQMRNLKKQGFLIYSVGEILLPIITIILLGSGSMGGLLMITGLIIPILFIILYYTQRKHLIH